MKHLWYFSQFYLICQLVSFLFYGKTEPMTDEPNQFTRDAWEANAEIWDARMGDEGNDFFKTKSEPNRLCYRRRGE